MAEQMKKQDFLTSRQGIWAAEVLSSMVSDSAYLTEPSFSANSAKYADNLMPFVDKHLAYMLKNPTTNPEHYLSNLKLMTRVRR